MWKTTQGMNGSKTLMELHCHGIICFKLERVASASGRGAETFHFPMLTPHFPGGCRVDTRGIRSEAWLGKVRPRECISFRRFILIVGSALHSHHYYSVQHTRLRSMNTLEREENAMRLPMSLLLPIRRSIAAVSPPINTSGTELGMNP